jgi:CRP/FNR family transcriptional regulator
MSRLSASRLHRRCSLCPALDTCLFANQSPEILARFQAITQVRLYQRGSSVFRQGDEVTGLFLIRSGAVRLYGDMPTDKVVSIKLAFPGDMLGLSEFTLGLPYQTNAEAVALSELEYVEREEFMALLQADPPLIFKLLCTSSRDSVRVGATLMDVLGKVAPAERLLRLLRDFARQCGVMTVEGLELSLPFSVQDLAENIGYSRERTSRIVNQLEAQRLLRREGRRIILPLDTLEDIH